jgi:homoprotocatechuate degradation regulator HpaR
MTKPLIRQRNLPLLLAQAREVVISNFRPILNHLGVTEQQWRIIRVLSENQVLEPWQISEQCQILKPSLTGVLTRMEEMGLIMRQRHDTDNRRQVVTLTERARHLIAEAAPLVDKQYRELEKALGKQLIADLYDVLDRLLDMQSVEVARINLPERKTNA